MLNQFLGKDCFIGNLLCKKYAFIDLLCVLQKWFTG